MPSGPGTYGKQKAAHLRRVKRSELYAYKEDEA